MGRLRPKCERVPQGNNDCRGENARKSGMQDNSLLKKKKKLFFFAVVFFRQNPVHLVIIIPPACLFSPLKNYVDNQTPNI